MTPAPLPRRYPDRTLGAALVGLFTAFALAHAAAAAHPIRPLFDPESARTPAAVGLAVGLLLTLTRRHGYRTVGFVAPGLTLLAAGMAWAAVAVPPPLVAGAAAGGLGLVAGAVGRYLGRGWRGGVARDGWEWPRWSQLVCFAVAAAGVGMVGWSAADPAGYRDAYPLLSVVGWVAVVGYAWTYLFRPFYELGCEPLVLFSLRLRAAGPGVDRVPYSGPVLVIANHACWWDPFILGQVVPRPVTAMMTAKFYDIWFLRPLLKHTFNAIRVDEVAVRRDAPEVRQAVAALDRGECVVVFPEGYLRRKEELPLRRFGRGIWEILKAKPDTPVVACWIEGGWGSWLSHRHGPPTKNKRIDFRLPVRLGMSAPVVLKPELLADHLRTRLHLMNEVSAARVHAGLEPLSSFAAPPVGDEESAS